jgi:hypothetical protein
VQRPPKQSRQAVEVAVPVAVVAVVVSVASVVVPVAVVAVVLLAERWRRRRTPHREPALLLCCFGRLASSSAMIHRTTLPRTSLRVALHSRGAAMLFRLLAVWCLCV